jgi:polygalacturonase
MNNDFHFETTDRDVSIWREPSLTEAKDIHVTFLDRQYIAANNHIEFYDLKADTAYDILLNDQNYSFHTLPAKRFIDITKKPYNAEPGCLCTEALQHACDDCDDTSAVYIPQGVFLTGALDMHSHSSMYLEKGAVLQGSEEPSDYEPRILSRFEGTERMCYRSLLNLGHLDHTSGPNCTDVLLYGRGEIRGGGFPLAQKCAAVEKKNLKSYLQDHPEEVAACENENTIPYRCRGRLINLSNCRNIRITGLTLGYGPSWNIHMVYSENIITDHCRILSEGVWNGDGWDPDSSENCILYACIFHTEDDSVAIKSGKNPEGNLISRPTKHIRIFDCISQYGHGICIGSEMSGGVEDVQIADCSLEHTMCGIEIKAAKKRGGYVRQIAAARCTVGHVQIHDVAYNDDGIAASSVPQLEDFAFHDLRLTGRYYGADHHWYDCSSILIHGFDAQHPIQNILFEHPEILQQNDLPIEDIKYCINYHKQ